MNNKLKFTIINTVLVCLLSLPNISSSKAINNNAKKYYGLYISGQYKPSVSVFSNFSVKETNVITKNLIALKKDVDSIETKTDASVGISNPSNFTIPYTAVFQDNSVNFNGTIGYTFAEGTRVEIEGSYEEFDVKNPGGYTLSDAYRYFALAREMKGNSFTPKEKVSNSIFHTVMRNDGLSIISVIVNVCYDFSLNNLSISPYICGGAGVDAIEFFDVLHIKFAYQSKLGIAYSLPSNISLFASLYYHKVMGNQFKNLNVQHVAELASIPKITSAVATLNIGYFGGEIGARLTF
ncbi:P44/Msp2 family outer membrane protein [Ehrlichia canis]|uniref:Surface antigen msp4 n=2 Tax=Ehrlichia canis TaxID=944 RepID=A0ACA6AWM1_EHRCJ|nr:P44/Msp2 family outer membrane protein [Ehrlichia canis]AAG14356.1 p28-1 [Ehrlichia canis]AAK28695.1 major outer membrane protein P30-5 [Ehrlichia canis]AAZ68941.1 Surface antigen msp4 [Ehrlichia canis str. Jake]